jgi:hypothetical protein
MNSKREEKCFANIKDGSAGNDHRGNGFKRLVKKTGRMLSLPVLNKKFIFLIIQY